MGRFFLSLHVGEVEVVGKVSRAKGVPTRVAELCVTGARSDVIVYPERSGLVVKVLQEENHEYLQRKVNDKNDCF